jgi:hypothetical protein
LRRRRVKVSQIESDLAIGVVCALDLVGGCRCAEKKIAEIGSLEFC